MADQGRELLRPEDATSLEEFEARCTVEQARSRAANSSNKALGQTVLAGLIGFVAILCWAGVATAHNGATWTFLVLALITTYLTLWLMSKVLRRGTRGSKRYVELSRLRKEWQEKAARGEIPPTTPGGIKVWQDELENEPRSS
jgi:hypothetical protein